MSEGHVYILTNEAMPGLVKIGRTSNCPRARANALSTTGLPFAFKVFYSVETPDCVELESDMHDAFYEYRVNLDREFFKVSPQDAADFLDENLEAQLCNMVEGYCPKKTVLPSECRDLASDVSSFISRCWPNTDIKIDEFGDFLVNWVRPEDMAKAIDRLGRHIQNQSYHGPLLPQVGWSGPEMLRE